MIPIPIITLLFFITFSTFAQKVNDDFNFFNYTYDREILKKNKVQTVTIELTTADGKFLSKSIFHFDKKGYLEKQVIKREKGGVLREYYFKRNSQNDLSMTIQRDYENNSVDTTLYFKEYDNNRLIKDSSTELPISYYYEYNTKGILIRTIIHSNFSLANKTKRVIVYTLDSLDRIANIKETLFQNENDLIGTLLSDRDFFYNKNDKLEKEIEKLNFKNSWMANNGSIYYVYDNFGNLTQLIRTNAASYTYTYNKKRLVLTRKMKLKTEPDNFDKKGINIETLDKYSYTYRR
jgi:YD repeat-containing protein